VKETMDEDIFYEEEQVPEPEDEEDFTITTDSRDPDRIFWYDMCALNICGIYFPWLERDTGVLLYFLIFFNFLIFNNKPCNYAALDAQICGHHGRTSKERLAIYLYVF
jgi:hypothetical protein